jgi:hypothetical protein
LYCCGELALWGESSAPTITITTSDKSNIHQRSRHWYLTILPLTHIYFKSWRNSNHIIRIRICITHNTTVDITFSVPQMSNVVFFVKCYTIKVECISVVNSSSNTAVITSSAERLTNDGSLHVTLVYYTLAITIGVDAVCDIFGWYKCVAPVESLTGPFVYVISNDKCLRISTNVSTPLSFHFIYAGDRHRGRCRDAHCHHYRRDVQPSGITSLRPSQSSCLLQCYLGVTINMQNIQQTDSTTAPMPMLECQALVCIPSYAGMVTIYHNHVCLYCHYFHYPRILIITVIVKLVKQACTMTSNMLSGGCCVCKVLLEDHLIYPCEILKQRTRDIRDNMITDRVLKYYRMISTIIANRNCCNWCRVTEVEEVEVEELCDACEVNAYNLYTSLLKGAAHGMHVAHDKIFTNVISSVAFSIKNSVLIILNELSFSLCCRSEVPRRCCDGSLPRTGQSSYGPTTDMALDGSHVNAICTLSTISSVDCDDCDANSDSFTNKNTEDSDFEFIFPTLNKYKKNSHIYLFASIDRIVADKGNVLLAIPELIEEHYVFILLQQRQGETISITRIFGNSLVKLIATKIFKEINIFYELYDSKMLAKLFEPRTNKPTKKSSSKQVMLKLIHYIELNPGPEMQSKMTVITLNCRGLGDVSKMRLLLNGCYRMTRQGETVILLQETMITNSKYIELAW